jgi:competence protein ComEC
MTTSRLNAGAFAPALRFSLGVALLVLACAPVGAQVEPPAGTASAVAVQAEGRGEPYVQISFLDVGQGDAVVIQSPEGQVAIIDAGLGDPLRFLQHMRIDEVDLLVASHPHADHIGGLDDILTARPVRFYLDNGIPHTTATYQRLMATLERIEEVTVLAPVSRTIRMGSVSIRVLPLPTGDLDLNDQSVGLVLEFGDFSAFFSGDSERYELDWWTGQGLVPDVTLLKAPHHGSANGFTRDFLAAARPEVVVVSVGEGNNYGHPRPEALTAYGTFADQLMRTDRDGPVTVLGYEDGRYELVFGPDIISSGGDAVQDGDSIGDAETADQSGTVPSGGAPPPDPSPGSMDSSVAGLRLDVVADAPGNDHEHLNGEFAIIENGGTQVLNIGRWRLCDLRSRCFEFPPGSSIPAGEQVRVYTGYGSSDGFSFFMNNSRAVWNNDGDEATLYDERGRMVLRYVY